MKKIVRIGVAVKNDVRPYSVYCKIIIEKGVLSITGVEGPLPYGRCLGSCGQIIASEWNIVTYAHGWDSFKEKWFRAIWNRYHLNDMQAGCEHQVALGMTYSDNKGCVCPICKYQIGTEWNREELPSWVVEWLTALPDADMRPAWV